MSMKKLNVTILHPDLGIGGAERLVVDAAMAMKELGHKVRFVTNHHNHMHCFDETKNGTFPVTMVGNWLPRTLFGLCYGLCSYIRMMYAVLYIALMVGFGAMPTDIVFVDQVSACVPLLKFLIKHSTFRVVFYCHFPDQLLVVGRKNILKMVYRIPLDWLETKSMGTADIVLVNSKFTLSVYRDLFKDVGGPIPLVLYPSINTAALDGVKLVPLEGLLVPGLYHSETKFLLSINRFERKKNLNIAIRCLRLMPYTNVKLVIAGGFDPQSKENMEYFQELVHLVIDQDLADRVFFLKSPSDGIKVSLLKKCICLLYTPSYEHFGIVPLEAMYFSKAVVAVNNGGPLETIVDGYNGYLCDAGPQEFCDAVVELMQGKNAEVFGQRGRQRFDELFSYAEFKKNLKGVIDGLYEQP